MADQYGLFWNSVGNDRGYTADSFAEWLNHFFTTGVFEGELQVTAASGMAIKVGSGYANLKGKVRFFDSESTYTLATAGATYPRIDTVVVERNDTDRKISIKVVTGTYNGSNPSPTAPVRSAAIYQIVLAQIYVAAGATKITQANITDTRSNNSVCGIVTGTVKEMDYSQFAAQFNGYYEGFKQSNKADFDTWFNQMKNQLTTDAAGNLQNEIDACMPKSGGTFTGNVFSNYEISDQYGKMFAANEYSAGSVKELIDKVRYTNGAAGSVSFSASSVISGYTIQAIWHNFIWIPHRTGGLNGKANNDNSNFGTLLLFPFSGSFLGYAIRLSTGSIDSCIPLSSVTKSFTLTSAGWSNSAQTITDGMITGTSNQEVIPAIGITKEQLIAFQNAMIVDAGQSSGSMTLKVMGTLPKIDIPIRVIFRGNI